jgi:septum formation protein
MPLWLARHPLVLASKSAARQAMLRAAGIPIEVLAADVDERAIEARASSEEPNQVAALLAREKAAAVNRLTPGRLVLGADQVLTLDTKRFSKPADRSAARVQLLMLSGRTHELHSAAACVYDGKVLFEHVGVARLAMRALSDAFVDDYLDAVGGAATASVGAYQLEGPGVQLFERVDGDYFTILGMPLLPVLDFLRRHGCLAS